MARLLQAMILLAGLTCTACVVAQASPPESKHQSREFSCEVRLGIDRPAVAQGERFTLTCQLTCTAGSFKAFNGFLEEEFPLPCQIVVISADGKLRREVLNRRTPPHGSQPLAEGVLIGEGTSIGRVLTILCAGSQGHPAAHALDLPAGQYVVQAVYTHWLLAKPGKSGGELQPPAGLSAGDMDGPLVVSAPVRFEITERPAAERRPDDAAAAETAPVEIQMAPTAVRCQTGKRFEIELQMVNRAERMLEVFAPAGWFCAGRQRTAQAVIARGDVIVGDLLIRPESPSTRTLRRDDWMRIPPGGSFWKKREFVAGRVLALGHGTLELRPGPYTIELRLSGHSFGGRPDLSPVDDAVRKAFAKVLGVDPASVKIEGATDEAFGRMPFEEWQRTFPGPELLRSNRIALEVLPLSGN